MREASGQGTDLVKSPVDFSLAGQEIENMILTGDGDIGGTGNPLVFTVTVFAVVSEQQCESSPVVARLWLQDRYWSLLATFGRMKAFRYCFISDGMVSMRCIGQFFAIARLGPERGSSDFGDDVKTRSHRAASVR